MGAKTTAVPRRARPPPPAHRGPLAPATTAKDVHAGALIQTHALLPLGYSSHWWTLEPSRHLVPLSKNPSRLIPRFCFSLPLLTSQHLFFPISRSPKAGPRPSRRRRGHAPSPRRRAPLLRESPSTRCRPRPRHTTLMTNILEGCCLASALIKSRYLYPDPTVLSSRCVGRR